MPTRFAQPKKCPDVALLEVCRQSSREPPLRPGFVAQWRHAHPGHIARGTAGGNPPALARRRGAHSLRVFGSVARGEANENSDLDLLVAWEPGRSLLDHAGLVGDLQELLGMKVHVGTEKALHWYVRDRILREATPL